LERSDSKRKYYMTTQLTTCSLRFAPLLVYRTTIVPGFCTLVPNLILNLPPEEFIPAARVTPWGLLGLWRKPFPDVTIDPIDNESSLLEVSDFFVGLMFNGPAYWFLGICFGAVASLLPVIAHSQANMTLDLVNSFIFLLSIWPTGCAIYTCIVYAR